MSRHILRMNRRTFLAATGVAAAGCLHEPEPEVNSVFAGADCPSFGDVDETRCYHEVGTTPDVYLVPDREAGDPRQEEFTMTLHNESGGEIRFGENARSLYKKVDGEWRSMMSPFAGPVGAEMEIPAGETYTWSLDMTDSSEVETLDMTRAIELSPANMRYTGAGEYAFRVTTNQPEGVEYVVLLEVEGDELSFEPYGVVNQTRDGDVLEAELVRDEDTGSETVVTARRTEPPETELDPILSELAVQLHLFNNTLALLDNDAEEVRFVGDSGLFGDFELLVGQAELLSARVDGDDFFGYDRPFMASLPNGSVEELEEGLVFRHGDEYYEMAVQELELPD